MNSQTTFFKAIIKLMQNPSETTYLQSFVNDISNFLIKIWHYKLFTLDTQSVLISSVILAIIFLFVGLRIAKIISKIINSRLLKALNLERNANHLLGKMIHYLIAIIIIIVVLDIAHFPLTIFTFVGGALAVSFGVGGQHVMNNFISGIILMIENRIKLGDMIQLDDLIGRVQGIDARSVNVKTPDNTNIFIPHSVILQNAVVNWTNKDSRVRLSTTLHISQSPLNINKIKNIILAALELNQSILINPVPEVFLVRFEYNILVIEVDFWVNLSFTKRKEITSEINYLILEALENNNVQLAIPKRTITK